jgi:hypothetical protein
LPSVKPQSLRDVIVGANPAMVDPALGPRAHELLHPVERAERVLQTAVADLAAAHAVDLANILRAFEVRTTRE